MDDRFDPPAPDDTPEAEEHARASDAWSAALRDPDSTPEEIERLSREMDRIVEKHWGWKRNR